MQYQIETSLKLNNLLLFKTPKVDPVTFYKRRTTIIFGISG